MGNLFSTLITRPLGMVLSFIYFTTHSYGLAIILFTIVIKLILLPLAIKQQKSMADMQKIQPLISDLQKKYKNDKEKLNQEMMKIYQEHKVNPAGGCLPLLIQMPIIFGLYRVIYQPLTYILNLTKNDMLNIIKQLGLAVNENQISQKEIYIAEQMRINFDKLANIDVLKHVRPIDFSFLHIINLADTPNMNQFSLLWLIPLLAALTTYLSSKLTSAASAASSQQNAQAAQMQKSMMTVFPIMTAFISFSLPAGVGIYWVVNNLITMVQQMFLNKYFAPVAPANKEGKG